MSSSLPATAHSAAAAEAERPAAKWLERVLFALIFLVALFAPAWTKAAVLFFRLAVVVWVVKLVWLRPKLPSLPIVKPLLLYFLLVLASTLFSPLPILSWGRMRTVELFLVALLVACNLRRSAQVKALVVALTLTTLIAVGYGGWVQLRGIGVRISQPTAAMLAAGLRPEDAILALNGRRLHDRNDWESALSTGEERVRLKILRGEPGTALALEAPRSALVSPRSEKPAAVEVARPRRMRGFFYSYIPFAEILMLMSLVAFGLFICFAQARKPAAATLWGMVFAIFLAGLVATETRAAVAAVLVVGVAALWLVGGWKLRAAGAVALLLLIVAGAFWFRAERGGLGWIGARDPGTDYRLLMWKDGVRLALEHPLVGIGMDTVERRGQELNIEAYKKYPNLKSHFHSTYVQIAAECGLPALAAWVWVMAALLLRLWQCVRHGPQVGFDHHIYLGLLAAVTAFVLASAAHYTAGDAEAVLVFWLLCGMALLPTLRPDEPAAYS